MTTAQSVELLKQQLPGFYSVEQVIEILNGIEEEKVESKPKLSQDDLREITRSILDNIEEEDSRENIVDKDDIEFDISYDRRIEVNRVCINFDVIRDCIENALGNAFEVDED